MHVICGVHVQKLTCRCLQVFASKDAEIADLRKRLAELAKKHSPCDDLIASLRKQIAALEMSRDYAKVCSFPCSLAVSLLPCPCLT